MLNEEKNRKLNDLLDALDFNPVVLFVVSPSAAATVLNKLLRECNFPPARPPRPAGSPSGVAPELQVFLADLVWGRGPGARGGGPGAVRWRMGAGAGQMEI